MKYKDYEGPAEVLIRQKLKEIEEREHVIILHAVESGSRAWGFASPDSDYDVRFCYLRPMEAYLDLQKRDDFIDWSLDETLDINGWDLSKALQQFKKSNATLFEWANSPVVYDTTPLWQRIMDTANQYFAGKSAMYHYYGTANKNYLEYLTGEQVRYKKYFYVLRPILACRWIEERQCPPPVLFQDLVDTVLEESLREPMARLIEKKKAMTEAELGPVVPEIHAYIQESLSYYKAMLENRADDRNPDWGPLNRLFLDILREERQD